MLTLEDCTEVLTPLALALGARVDVPTFRAYHRALRDIPRPVLEAAVALAERRPRDPYSPLFPPAPTIRALAEDARKALIAAHPYTGCAECEDSIGFRPRLDQRNTVDVCPCRQRHAEKLAELGVVAPLALQAAREDGERT